MNNPPSTMEEAIELGMSKQSKQFAAMVTVGGLSYTQAWEQIKSESSYGEKLLMVLSAKCVEAGNVAVKTFCPE